MPTYVHVPPEEIPAANASGVISLSASCGDLRIQSTSTPEIGETINKVTWTLTIVDTGYANDGRVIVIEAPSQVGSPVLISDTGGTPNGRVVTGDLVGTGADFKIISSDTNDFVVTGDGTVTGFLEIEDTGGNSSDVTPASILSGVSWRTIALDHVGSGGSAASFSPSLLYTPAGPAVFDGATSYGTVATDPAFNFGNGTVDSPFSLSATIKVNTISGTTSEGIVSKYRNTGSLNAEWALAFKPATGTIFFNCNDNNTSNTISNHSTTVFNAGQEYDVVATYDGSGLASGINLYIDGVLDTGTDGGVGSYTAMHVTTSPVEIGVALRDSGTFIGWFDGEISNVGVYSTELTALQAATLPAADIAYWDCDGDLTDSVGGFDMTNNNVTFSSSSSYEPTWDYGTGVIDTGQTPAPRALATVAGSTSVLLSYACFAQDDCDVHDMGLNQSGVTNLLEAFAEDSNPANIDYSQQDRYIHADTVGFNASVASWNWMKAHGWTRTAALRNGRTHEGEYTVGRHTFKIVTPGASQGVSLPTQLGGTTFNFEVDWGDGTVDQYYFTDSASHTYGPAAEYEIKVVGTAVTVWKWNDAGVDDLVTEVSEFDCPGLQLTTMENAFFGCSQLASATGFDLTGVTDTQRMFGECISLLTLDTSDYDMSLVTTMYQMFAFNNWTTAPDVSLWDTGNCTTFRGVFEGCDQVTSPPDVSGWDVSVGTNFLSMFSTMTGLTTAPDVSSWVTTAATNMSRMFLDMNAITVPPDVSGFTTASVTTFENMFGGVNSITTAPDVSLWTTRLCTDMSSMFFECRAMATAPGVSSWDVSKVTTFESMFDDTRVMPTPNVSNWVVTEAESFAWMFQDTWAFTTPPDTSGWLPAKVTTCFYMFYNSGITSGPDLSGWDLAACTTVKAMFRNAQSMVTPPDVTTLDISNVGDLSEMFLDCTAMTSPPDTSLWVTTAATNMSLMFSKCTLMTTPPDVGGWDMNGVTTVQRMFEFGINTSPPDTSTWDVSTIQNFSAMFEDAGITSAPDTSSWTVTAATTFAEMFYRCYDMVTGPDMTGWTFPTNISMASFCNSCTSMTSIPHTGIETGPVGSWSYAFNNCPAVDHVFVASLDWDSASNLDHTFSNPMSAAEIDAWLIKLELESTATGTIDYEDITTGGAYLDSNRSGAASTAITDLVTAGWIRQGTY